MSTEEWKNALHLNWKKRMYVLPNFGTQQQNITDISLELTRVLKVDQLTDWSTYVLAKKMTFLLLRQVASFSHFLELRKTTTLHCMSKFIQLNISFLQHLIQCADPSGSLIVRFYRASNHLSHSWQTSAWKTQMSSCFHHINSRS